MGAVIANANSCGHMAIIESSTLKSTMPGFHLDNLKLVCARSAKPHRAKKTRTGETTDASEAKSHAPWAVPAAATDAVVPGPLAVPSNVQPPCLGILTQAGQQALLTARDGSEQFKGLSLVHCMPAVAPQQYEALLLLLLHLCLSYSRSSSAEYLWIIYSFSWRSRRRTVFKLRGAPKKH